MMKNPTLRLHGAGSQVDDSGQMSFCPCPLCMSSGSKATNSIHKVAQMFSDILHKMLSTMSGT